MNRRRPLPRDAGTTLVELMVALAVGMVLSLAVFGLLSSFEGRKRTLNAGNDLEQAGQLAMYKLDAWLRSAGAGMAQAAAAYGCPLHAAKSGGALLPLPAGALAAAPLKANVAGAFGLAPVLIVPGATTPGGSGKPSDALVVMSAAPVGGVPLPFAAPAAGDTLTLAAGRGDLAGGDLVLVGDTQTGDDGQLRPCMLQQVAANASAAASAVPLAGPFHAASIGSASLAAYSSSGFALRLGNAAGALPRLQLVAVGDNNVLYSRDLLAGAVAPPKAEAEGVFELHALYGVDTDGDGKADDWVAPSGDYGPDVLSSGTPEASARLRRIKAVRVGLLTRTALPEREEVTAGPLTLFADLPALCLRRTLAAAEKHYRYGTVQETVPVRNNLLVP
jgi:type IV pilus assembly protein PilW